MLNSSGSRDSAWMSAAQPRTAGALDHNIDTQVCVVGAGISGLMTAYLLTREHRSVVVIDDGPVGGGETGRTTAHLSNAIDDRYVKLERLHGPEGARLAAESHSAAIDQIETIVNREAIACDFKRLDGYLFTPPGADNELLDRELAAAQRAGVRHVERVDRTLLGEFDTGPCLRFARQGQFHPMKYLAGLQRAITRDGGEIFTDTHAHKIEGGPTVRVTTGRGAVITAAAVVVATNSPVNDLVAIHTKQAAYRTYVIAARVPRGSVAEALFWDTADPYHYVRTQPGEPDDAGHDLLIVGGEDHKTGQADDAAERWRRLELWARERFPILIDVPFRWSGQIMETMDGLAFIGRNPLDSPNVYVVTGDSGHGMTHGTIAGMLLTDLIMERPNRWARLYDPSRKTVRAIGTFARENVNFAVHYADWVRPGDVASGEQIEPGSGAVIRDGLKMIAAYRDESGLLHECSAVCSHLGCIVHWNSGEKTWDCPCHGSRFDPYGHVVNGPAISNLAPLGAPIEAAH